MDQHKNADEHPDDEPLHAVLSCTTLACPGSSKNRMGFLHNLESSLKNLESRIKKSRKGTRSVERRRARPLAMLAPHAEELRESGFTKALLDHATRIGFTKRVKVHIAWIGTTLRLKVAIRSSNCVQHPKGSEQFSLRMAAKDVRSRWT